MVREKYQDIETITVVGFPEEFTYAFIGKIGLLSNDKTLIKDAIDIYRRRKTGFVKQRYGGLLPKQGQNNSSSFYFDIAQYPEHLPFGTVFKDIFKHMKMWHFSNRYGDGKVVSEHYLVLSHLHDQPQTDSRQAWSMTPSDAALLLSADGVEPTYLWDICQNFFGIEMRASESRTDLGKYLGKQINVIMLGSSDKEVRLIPAMAFLIPLKDVPAVEKHLLELRNSIRISGKKLKFPGHKFYHGVDINVAELSLGFIFSVKGGYAIIDEYLVVGTTIPIIQQIIDTASGQQNPLNLMDYQLYLKPESTGYLFIQPSRLVPELEKIASFYALIARISQDQQTSQIASQISKNLYPLSSLGGISANFSFHERQATAEVMILSGSR
jgi:hypothetical protein